MKSRGQVIATRLGQLRYILFSILQEIFDESAYARFLARQGLTTSREAYGRFLREQGEAKAHRPKCC
jgi:hypothetical protein